jgi:hypothetical protein
MQAEKKKLLILGVLALVILCVGAFSLVGGHKADVKPTPAAGGHHSHRYKSADPETPTSTTPAATVPGASPTASAPGSDLAKPPVGQSPFGKPEVVTGKPGASTTASPGGPVAMAPVTEQDFPERDPFDGTKYIPQDKKTVAAPPPAAAPAEPVSKSSRKLGNIPPLTITGADKGLPTADGSKVNLPALGDKPAAKDDFDYTVTGVITGDRPTAVFVDGKGDQRLVSLGGSVDGDTRVVSIRRGQVTVDHHGKKRTLSVGADTPTEKR